MGTRGTAVAPRYRCGEEGRLVASAGATVAAEATGPEGQIQHVEVQTFGRIIVQG